MPRPLTPIEVRVLGCFIEKQLATPDAYPLTLNSLVAACNQKSNRDPETALSDADVLRAVDALRVEKLALLVHVAGSRVAKYEHNLAVSLPLPKAPLAVLCELLVRGPQTVGELRGRASRMYPLATPAEVEAALALLAAHNPPLVVKLPIQPGRKEPRFCQLLGGEPGADLLNPAPMPEPVRLQIVRDDTRLATLEAEVAALRAELATVRTQLDEVRALLK